jgi:hypothetical protein
VKFAGGITNTGAITTTYEYGIEIESVGNSTFSGGITNSGAIDAKGSDAYGIYIDSVADDTGATFTGNIVNSGAYYCRL